MIKPVLINCGKYGMVRVWAVVDGVFAIHKEIHFDGFGDGWTISHIPTGLNLRRDNKQLKTKRHIQIELNKLKKMRFNNRGLFQDYGPCELLEIMPLFFESEGKSKSYIEFWKQEIGEPAIKNLGCLE